jgi:hypothetical protein
MFNNMIIFTSVFLVDYQNQNMRANECFAIHMLRCQKKITNRQSRIIHYRPMTCRRIASSARNDVRLRTL